MTHSLFGVVLAEAGYQYLAKKKKPKKELRPVLYFASIFANNFPDLDFLFSLIDPTKLGYLLHHRGHTHTFLWIWPQVLILLLGIFLFCKFRQYIFTKTQWLVLTLLVVVGFHLHVGLDFLNSYGVHPWAPLDRNWFYGDILFIMEPFVWFSLLPMVLLSLQRKWIAWTLVGLATALMFYGFTVNIISWLNVLIVILFFSGLYYSLRFKKTKRQLLVTLLVVVSVIGSFWSAGHAVKYHLKRDAISFVEGGGVILDIMATPLPGNPFCWSFHVLEVRDNIYRVHTGVFTHSPFGRGVMSCPSFPTEKHIPATSEHPLKKYSKGDAAYWTDIYEQSVNELLQPYESHCRFRYWLQFARFPFRTGDIYNDLRYARRAKNFSTLDLKEYNDSQCPVLPTSWVPPRQDLINIFLKNKKAAL